MQPWGTDRHEFASPWHEVRVPPGGACALPYPQRSLPVPINQGPCDGRVLLPPRLSRHLEGDWTLGIRSGREITVMPPDHGSEAPRPHAGSAVAGTEIAHPFPTVRPNPVSPTGGRDISEPGNPRTCGRWLDCPKWPGHRAGVRGVSGAWKVPFLQPRGPAPFGPFHSGNCSEGQRAPQIVRLAPARCPPAS